MELVENPLKKQKNTATIADDRRQCKATDKIEKDKIKKKE